MMILCGGPARETKSDLFKLHYDSLVHQASAVGGNLIVEHTVVPPLPGHRWDLEKIERVARVREDYLIYAHVNYDALFMVDTDVVIGPSVLERLLAVNAPVVYGVFWTKWPLCNESLPQVWDIHPCDYTPQLRDKFHYPGEVEVFGGGACTLIREPGFQSCYYPLLRSLRNIKGGMWAGEDRTFCLGLETRGIKQIAVLGLPIHHLYYEEQQTPENLKLVREEFGY